jgi:hypothetical protein
MVILINAIDNECERHLAISSVGWEQKMRFKSSFKWNLSAWIISRKRTFKCIEMKGWWSSDDFIKLIWNLIYEIIICLHFSTVKKCKQIIILQLFPQNP